jgi:hypothetical protein
VPVDTMWRAGEIERSRVVRDTLKRPLCRGLHGEELLRAIVEFKIERELRLAAVS